MRRGNESGRHFRTAAVQREGVLWEKMRSVTGVVGCAVCSVGDLFWGSALGGGSGEPHWTRGLGEMARNGAERSISGSVDGERSGGGREASGEAEPREDAHPAKAGRRSSGTPARGCTGQKSVSAVWPRPSQPVNGWKGQPSEQIPQIILLFEAPLQGHISRTTQILSSKSRHILGVK